MVPIGFPGPEIEWAIATGRVARASGVRLNGVVASTEAYLTRAAVALSVILVLLLGGLALFSVFGAEEGNGDEVGDDPDTTVGGPTAYPGQQYNFDDASQPLTIGCVPTIGNTDVYVVSITNRSERAIDYLVKARLTPESGSPVDALAEVTNLQPSEAREVVLVPDRPIDEVDACTITAIESERRVLLANS